MTFCRDIHGPQMIVSMSWDWHIFPPHPPVYTVLQPLWGRCHNKHNILSCMLRYRNIVTCFNFYGRFSGEDRLNNCHAIIQIQTNKRTSLTVKCCQRVHTASHSSADGPAQWSSLLCWRAAGWGWSHRARGPPGPSWICLHHRPPLTQL